MQLFQENEEDGHDKAEESGKMVPLQRLSFEHYRNQNCEHSQRNHLLDDLELHEIERTSVFNISYPVRRNLRAVFQECHSP